MEVVIGLFGFVTYLCFYDCFIVYSVLEMLQQSTGKKSGRGGGRGGFGPMRGRGGMRGMGRAPPYMRDGRGDYDRRPGLPPPSMRNGYYDNYDRGYDNYYPSRGPPPVMASRDR